MSFAEGLISILGKVVSSNEVIDMIKKYALTEVYDDPPFRKYIGSSEKGVDLLLENDVVFDIQFFVQRSETHFPFREELPFGIQVGMSDKEVHSLLGEPMVRDSIGSKYMILNGRGRLTIVYDKTGVVNYLSITLSGP